MGRPERAFLAAREGGARFHVGVDLFAREGDEVLACEDGTIVAFQQFYRAGSTSEMLYALLVEHRAFVINYGEVNANSLLAYGLR